MDIPKEYQLKCEGCGKTIDMRDPSQVLSHGWLEGDKAVCYDEEPIEYDGSKKIDEPIFWTKDKNPIHLS